MEFKYITITPILYGLSAKSSYKKDLYKRQSSYRKEKRRIDNHRIKLKGTERRRIEVFLTILGNRREMGELAVAQRVHDNDEIRQKVDA